ncbi:TolC family protein [Xylophilus sp. GOD-11R]|uniref:TolC family protein n=1 Tax=Xylophilus sp. GOD-11R TaxID=3089814 RepID=UPI00298D364F|nr:TolC family protein [Xylophilus sp. GOD-11R]WPB55528.1 TolC family protein [Xylophilus sp. GOD-11R]
MPSRTWIHRAAPILLLCAGMEGAAAQARPAAVPPPAVFTLPAGDIASSRPPQLSLDTFLALVRSENPALLADRYLVDMARADLRTASTLPNPAISHGRGAGERQTAIEQPIPLFGQRGMRMEGARRGIDATAANVEALAAGTLRDAAGAFVALLAAQERADRWSEAQGALAEAAAIVEGQVSAGARSRYDLTRIRVETANLAMRLAQAEAAEAAAASEVAAFVGAPDWRPRAVGSLRPAADSGRFDSRWQVARERLPSVRAALAAERLAETLIEVERREALPTPSVGVGRLHDADGRHTLIGVSVEIPLFDRRQGPIERARAQADESRQRRRAVVADAEATLRRSVDQFQRLQRLTDRFGEEGLSQLPELGRMARDAYQLGRGSILELIDAILSGTEKQVAYTELQEQVLRAEVEVRSASGAFASTGVD